MVFCIKYSTAAQMSSWRFDLTSHTPCYCPLAGVVDQTNPRNCKTRTEMRRTGTSITLTRCGRDRLTRFAAAF
ncbi:hypothetical protein LIPSTDRAFT_304048 [Lipomyces starkeyi NRRL Y-11557]|uniref:Uncharacterized protein n=1 Tax=Lipomyces starkeyi NRRL Y-11557 TaxID=675824 RepID=A0A1E3Q687_LIPST|nr:hypothetical protein LIPSTDRAFT_304048 [Lipomyces starkeyi NRRL Y-11557]